MLILGLSAYYHDSAACLVRDGRVIAAAQEERFTRRKHDPSFPAHAISWMMEEVGIRAGDLDAVVFHDKPKRKFDRLLKTYLSFAPEGVLSFRHAMGAWLGKGGKLNQRQILLGEFERIGLRLDAAQLLFSDHHLSHAASAYYPSPFSRALVLTVDGVGEWATTTAGIGDGDALTLNKELRFPHSLGLLYSAFTQYTGFRVNSGEYKLMGLAPYGQPRYVDTIYDNLIDVKDDGTFCINQMYFDYCTGISMINDRFAELFGHPPRARESEITQHEMDVAASIQAVTEDVMARLVRGLVVESGIKDLCLAGGVALNCVSNGKLLHSGVIDRLWVQPAAGDAGCALGAALAAHHFHFGAKRAPTSFMPGGDAMVGAYLGPGFTDDQAASRLEVMGAKFERLDEAEMLERTAQALAYEKVVGWFQGRMEFGPRALGARSILGDPRSTKMQRDLNLKIKYRESFRPFAPSVLAEHADEWFDLDAESPYMLVVADVHPDKRHKLSVDDQERFGIDLLNVPKSEIPAVTHVDGSARVQTVHAETNSRYHALIEKFHVLTGCPVLVNTSFNVRGEPIVCTPEDAFRCFMGTEMDVLVVENCVLVKEDQDPSLVQDYKNAFEAD